ncbi:MAG: SDR family oxidoreductase [Hellea sp.]|jgi:NAD(P)-dependent dehydrogenase (short-subunit alcohol dehydrogenase family)|nr:SDR family oxidoreductase [Hellea sp.]MBT5837339.1 SDR family oxidoreductase [Hellea sp.]MDG1127218.1 SDR family oxidoreductase [Hellea sp.]
MTKAILITGSGTRIGAFLAKNLSKNGWAVAIHYNKSRDSAELLSEEIRASGGEVALVKADLSISGDLDVLIKKASENLGLRLTALINNASTFEEDSLESFTNSSFDYHMDINLRAPIILSQKFAEQLPSNTKGQIINIIDQRVLNSDPSFFTYSISKSALFWATKTMAQTLAPNIRVNAIGPGPTIKNYIQTDEDFNSEINSTLLKNGSPPDELLKGILYLLSDASVTGHMIPIDGGQHLSFTS